MDGLLVQVQEDDGECVCAIVALVRNGIQCLLAYESARNCGVCMHAKLRPTHSQVLLLHITRASTHGE